MHADNMQNNTFEGLGDNLIEDLLEVNVGIFLQQQQDMHGSEH